MTWRKWAFRIGAIAASPFIALLVVEAGARVLAPPAEAELAYNAPDNAPDGLYTNSHEVAHIPTPNFEGTAVSPGYRVKLRVNSLGLRGPEPTEDKGTERWLVGGDSFTFAAQVSEEDTFVQLLATEGRETFNAGADGYGTWQPLRRYELLDEELGLDGLLIVFFTGNDLGDNERGNMELQNARRMADGVPKPMLAFNPFERWVSRHSFLYARWKIVQRTESMKDPNSHERQRWAQELAIFTQGGESQLKHQLTRTSPILSKVKGATQQRGDRLLIAVAPPGFAVDPVRREAAFGLVGHSTEGATPRAPTDAVLGELERQGIPSCDLHTPLQAAIEAGETVYFDFDGHWTPRGHEVVAQALTDCLGG